MKKSIILFLGSLLFLSVSSAQEPAKIIEQFFSTYPKNIDKAVTDIFKTNNSSTRKRDEITKLKNQLIFDVNKVGQYYGFEFISERKIGQSLVLYSYLLKYELQPIRFSFIFYYIEEKWVLFKFGYDADVITELEESAKFYYLE